VARNMKIALPADAAVDAEVDLGTSGDQFLLRVRLGVSLPGLDRDVARAVTRGSSGLSVFERHTRQHRRLNLI
jgi:osmotically inducible protein OsmC